MAKTKSAKQQADLQEKRNALYRRIIQWREVQLAYMPAVASLLLKSGVLVVSTDDETVSSELAETFPLHLPSSLPPSLRQTPELTHLVKKELRLRLAQADEALESIRRGRRMISSLIQFKKFNISGAGNKPNTRLRTVLNRLQASIQHSASTYQTAYNTLLTLDPDGEWRTQFRKLDTADIRGPGQQPDDSVIQPSGRYETSWIWLVRRNTGVVDSDELMQVEWAKMKARQDRWNEEYLLLQEEMRRTVVYLEWKARWWRKQATRRSTQDPIFSQALYAYAERQAYLLDMLAASCIQKWIPLLKENGADISWASKYQNSEDSGDRNVDTEEEEEEEEEEVEKIGDKDEDEFDSYELGD